MPARPTRQPRRAYDRDGKMYRPVTIGEMIANEGIRHLNAYCINHRCHHRGRVNVETWPPDMAVPDASTRLVCSVCGERHKAQVMPDWLEIDKERSAQRRTLTHSPSG